jgi:hypothetical protein
VHAAARDEHGEEEPTPASPPPMPVVTDVNVPQLSPSQAELASTPPRHRRFP